MPNPNGYPATLKPVRPGEVRNPKGVNGATKARPVVDALERFIAERPAERYRELAQIFYAMATGHREALRLRDGTVLKPDFVWFRELLDRLDGKAPDLVKGEHRVRGISPVVVLRPERQGREEPQDAGGEERVRVLEFLAELQAKAESDGGEP
jgi:hypothetical protein